MKGTANGRTNDAISGQSKIVHTTFDGKETYKGLESGFRQWAKSFLRCGHPWAERYKVAKFGQLMRGKANAYYTAQLNQWLTTNPSMTHVNKQMEAVFSVSITTTQTAELFKTKKPETQSWRDHFFFLMAVKNATNASDTLILENIVQRNATDIAAHAMEFAQWAQLHDEKVNSVADSARNVKEQRTCNFCHKKGYFEKDCKKKKAKEKNHTNGSGSPFSLAGACGDSIEPDDWIVDSVASVHLVHDFGMLEDVVTIDDRCTMPDGSSLHVTHKGMATMTVVVDRTSRNITLLNACYSPKLAVNLISLCSSSAMEGMRLRADKDVLWYVEMKNRVLVVDRDDVSGHSHSAFSVSDMVLSTLGDATPDDNLVPTESLRDFHIRFGHIAHDTIERMASQDRPFC
ncbi:TPA: LOW QUALITY PROTEIN: hypothetical protein N0F65_006215 [Lagenidium giganteum]|uniref:Retrovirus-related Pol polyprotein from transposon TNT 1-94-like beta-barrel domain-containing protein n=1 Tax=Lagenidium giganteum TaxID=4803 RepID=A0AAV2Z8V7_9STRA|nr:TPA: LOW QUALITY PROTEIN: hypothetical protein N0F65_006215 [Lagenidium giganteum]